MSFLREYAATDVASRTALTLRWLEGRPHELFEELRREQPIFLTPGFALVTRYADVFEVLGRDDVFLAGDRDDLLQAQDAALVRLCVRRDDVDLVATAAQEAARAAVAVSLTRSRLRLDIVTDLAQRVAGRVAANYLGVGGTDEITLVGLLDSIRRDRDNFSGYNPGSRHDALAAAAELGGYTDAVIGARRAHFLGAKNQQDILGRLLALQSVEHARLDDRRLHALLLGLLLALVDPIASSIAHALSELLVRPGATAAARAAVVAGDDAALWAILREALRFSPPRQVLARTCGQPYTLAKGTANEIVIRPGTVVLVAVASAAFDPEHVDDPEQFRPGRPEHHDFLFGHGLHACVGRHLAPIAVREACKALLLAGEPRSTRPPQREGARVVALPVVLSVVVPSV